MEILRAAADPSTIALADNIESIVASTGLPRPTDIAIQLVAFNIIAGFVLSLFASLAAISAYRSPEKRRRYTESHPDKNSDNR